jgi:hypothetical protein
MKGLPGDSESGKNPIMLIQADAALRRGLIQVYETTAMDLQ